MVVFFVIICKIIYIKSSHKNFKILGAVWKLIPLQDGKSFLLQMYGDYNFNNTNFEDNYHIKSFFLQSLKEI